MNKEIRFSAKDTGVADLMSRLRNESRRLYDDMARDAKSQSSSQKETLKAIEDQIKAIERRNKVDTQAEKISLKDRYDRGMSSATSDTQRSKLTQQYKEGMSQLKTDSEADKMQVELLKDILETTRQNSQSELKAESKEAVEDRMHRERMSQNEQDHNRQLQEQNDRPGAIAAGMKGIMYARGLGKSLEQGENGGKAALDTVAGGLMMSGNPYAMAAGGILDSITGLFTLVQDQMKMVAEAGHLTGRTGEDLLNSGFGYGGGDQDRIERIGMDREEYLQRYTSSVRSYGENTSESKVMRDIYAEKAMGLDQGTVSEIQKLTRTMGQFSEVQEVTNQVYRAMFNTGALGSNNTQYGRMQDIVNTAVTMQSDRFMRTGLQTGFEDRLKLMRGLEFMGGSFKDDRYKQATMQQLESGVSTMPNKMVHAMKLQQAKKLFPNQNPFELFATIQSGDPRLIDPLMQNVMGSTDNETLQMQRMYDLFGGQLSAQNVVQLSKKMKGRSDGGGIGVGLPGGDWSAGGSAATYRALAQSGTTEMGAESLMLWNNIVSESTQVMMKFQASIAGLLNMF